MPYIPVELDALNDFPHVARAANITENDASGGILRMWARVFRTQEETVTTAILAGLFGLDGERIATALEAFNFLEPKKNLQGVWRVKGSERLINAATAKTRGGEARASGAKRDKRGRMVSSREDPPPSNGRLLDQQTPAGVQQESSSTPALSPNTIHPTPNTSHLLHGAGESEGAKVLPLRPVQEDEAVKVGRALEQASGQPFWPWMQRQRAERGLQEEKEPKAFADWCWRAIALVGVRALSASYGRFLLDEDFQVRGWPVRVWMHENVWKQRAYDEVSR